MTVLTFSDFTADKIFNIFKLAHDETLERTAIRFVHNMISKEHPQKNFDKSIRSQMIADKTVEEISFRHGLFKQFYGDFFSNNPLHSESALMLATICGGYTKHIGERTSFLFSALYKNGFSEKILDDAYDIWSASGILLLGCNADDILPLYSDSIFLAHVLAIESLNKFKKLQEQPETEIINTCLTNIQQAWKFVRLDTEIGDTLYKYMLTVEDKILELREPPEDRRRRFRIVSSSDNYRGNPGLPEPMF